MVVTLLVWLSYCVLFVLGTVCLASGLFYIAELVEEFTMIAKKVIRYSIITIIIIHIILLLFGHWEVPDLPNMNLIVGIITHIVYYTLLGTFPFIELTDINFILSCVLAFSYHCMWFYHFLYYYYPLSEIMAIFLLLCWTIPFAFFVSLSANDNTLPSGAYMSGDTLRKSRKRNILRIFDWWSSKKKDIFGEERGYRSTGKIG